MKKVLGLIPARRGSKRLPGKNVRMFHGKPLLEWTIDQALESDCFSQITLSTDDPEALEIGMNRSVINCVPRDSWLTGDAATLNDVVLAELDRFAFCSFTHVCLLQPTSPLRIVADIRCGVALEHSISVGPTGAPNGAVYVVPVAFFKEHPYFGGASFYMPAERSIDINTLQEFEEAEKILTLR